MHKLVNSKCSFSFRPESKDIEGLDKQDQNNMPACYNITRRGLQKAWDALVAQFNEDTTMYQGVGVLTANGVRMRTFCMMD